VAPGTRDKKTSRTDEPAGGKDVTVAVSRQRSHLVKLRHVVLDKRCANLAAGPSGFPFSPPNRPPLFDNQRAVFSLMATSGIRPPTKDNLPAYAGVTYRGTRLSRSATKPAGGRRPGRPHHEMKMRFLAGDVFYMPTLRARSRPPVDFDAAIKHVWLMHVAGEISASVAARADQMLREQRDKRIVAFPQRQHGACCLPGVFWPL
jgi:hypothetical protein